MTNQHFNDYIQAISSKFSHKETSEMGYRTNFEILLKGIFESINVKRIGHDDKARQGNKPDFVVLKNDIPILYIETKDIGINLDKVEKSEQMGRYYGYTNLVLTDYVEFRFYRNGLRYEEPIKIAIYDLRSRIITPVPESYGHVAKTLLDFIQSQKEPITSGKHLAKIMAGKAQRIRDNIRQFLSIHSDTNAELLRVYETIKKFLVHELTKNSFADMYAQTLVYGLFAARDNDKSQGDFTRQEARDLIPKSNPFLRHFFDHIVGPNFDRRLEYIVDEMCEVFSHANVKELMKEYYKTDLWGETHSEPDPVIHFYEDFLKEYDPELRKEMGAYYTPLPVVQFIVRSVDCLLKKEFKLPDGLSDTSKTVKGLHRVQILDPAVGTGTFISKVIRNIFEHLRKTGQEGRWHPYVLHDLLPRLYGFELMMTPYTIAHLKLSMAFKETGFKYFNNRRLGIYLTNSLEEASVQQDLLTAFGLAESIAEESKEASKIKNKKPIMVVIGNPPYFGESSNKNYNGHDVYKLEPTGGKLKERNSKWLNDDYVKFIRFAESMIERTGEGIVAMITAHGYIDNPTFRGMRWHLMKTFNEIFVLDLHGNANKREKASDGAPDKNIFNIKQGVAIFVGIKRINQKKSFSKIYRADILGSRKSKFAFLNENAINTIRWQKVKPLSPNYEWIVIDKKTRDVYEKGFSTEALFPVSSVGIVTARDKMSIQYSRKDIAKVVRDFEVFDSEVLRAKYNLGRDVRDWKVELAKKDVIGNYSADKIVPIDYRPFDTRWTFYTGNSRGFHCMPRGEVMNHLIKDNLALVVLRQVKASDSYQHVFISRNIVESTLVSNKTSEIGYVLPLYFYNTDGSRRPNLEKEIVDRIEKIVGKVSPEDIIDYIYAVLYSPRYRKTYQEFLKKGFPRVPYPKNKKTFERLVKFGRQLRELHLLESLKVNKFATTYPVTGSNIVEKKPEYKEGKVFINDEQYFGKVPEVAWNFRIGGYQPAQKWLKDRKDRTLTNPDIEHYQKMIVVLKETGNIMEEIDKGIAE
ncbi:MAG: N-6 DNA methylase [Candidatus Pacebacteria bacterium]|nr:N-6 DNA methylase [Candidatus Paceibacterota bacterium]